LLDSLLESFGDFLFLVLWMAGAPAQGLLLGLSVVRRGHPCLLAGRSCWPPTTSGCSTLCYCNWLVGAANRLPFAAGGDILRRRVPGTGGEG